HRRARALRARGRTRGSPFRRRRTPRGRTSPSDPARRAWRRRLGGSDARGPIRTPEARSPDARSRGPASALPSGPATARSPRAGLYAGAVGHLRRGQLAAHLPERALALAKRLDDVRVELLPRLGRDLLARSAPPDCAPVRPVAGHRVERVGDGEDARAERHVVSAEPIGIPPPVPALVV